MEEIRMAPKKIKKKKRSGRSIAWLMEELNMAIKAEMKGLLIKYEQIKDSNGNYGPCYLSAVRLAPAYSLLTVEYPKVADALKNILDIKVQ